MLATKTFAVANALASLALITEAVNLDVFNTSADWLDDETFAQLEAERVIDGPEDIGFFKLEEYQMNTAEEKFNYLWE